MLHCYELMIRQVANPIQKSNVMIDIAASEALRDRLPAGDSAGKARLVSETGPGAAVRG
jgi:hypothetical protein